MDEKIYEGIGKVLRRSKIDEEAEDILLDMAEQIGETGILEKEVSIKEKYNRTMVEALGTCYPGEEGDEEPSVYIRLLKIGNTEFQIDDYLL